MIGLGDLISAAGSIYTGVTTLEAANKQAQEVETQGTIVFNEAFREASIIREEGRTFAATQSLQFIGAGVELVGSALITTAQTLKYTEAEAEAIEAKGGAQSDLSKRKAETLRSEGRAALIGSIIGTSSLMIGTETEA